MELTNDYSKKVFRKKENQKYFIFALFVNWEIIIGVITEILFLATGNNNLSDNTLLIIVNLVFRYSAIFYIAINCVKDNINVYQYILVFIVVLLYMYSYMFDDLVRDIVPGTLIRTIISIILMIAIINLNNRKLLIEKIQPFIWIAIIYALLKLVSFSINHEYDMSFSYRIYIPTILSLLLIKEKRIYLLSFLFLIIANMVAGSRGSFLCLLIALLLIVFLNVKEKYKYFIVLGTPFLIVLSITVFEVFISIMNKFFPDSRTIDALLTGKALSLSGRGEIYSYVWNKFCDNPFAIRGLLSDRGDIFLNISHAEDVTMEGCYAHNIVLEIVYQFGIIGVIVIGLSIVLLAVSLLNIKNSNDKNLKRLYVIFGSYTIGSLAFSSSYLLSEAFFLFCGIVAVAFARKKKCDDIVKQNEIHYGLNNNGV